MPLIRAQPPLAQVSQLFSRPARGGLCDFQVQPRRANSSMSRVSFMAPAPQESARQGGVVFRIHVGLSFKTAQQTAPSRTGLWEMTTSVIQQKGPPKDQPPHTKRGFPCITEVGINPLIPQRWLAVVHGWGSGRACRRLIWLSTLAQNYCLRWAHPSRF